MCTDSDMFWYWGFCYLSLTVRGTRQILYLGELGCLEVIHAFFSFWCCSIVVWLHASVIVPLNCSHILQWNASSPRQQRVLEIFAFFFSAPFVVSFLLTSLHCMKSATPLHSRDGVGWVMSFCQTKCFVSLLKSSIMVPSHHRIFCLMLSKHTHDTWQCVRSATQPR